MGGAKSFSAAFLLLSACRGEEVARVKLSKPGDSGDVSWKGGPVKVWADYKGKWSGASEKDPGFTYEVEVKEGTKSVTKVECKTATCSSSVCSNTTQVNNNISANCECLMSCTLDAPEGKDYTLTVKVSGDKGEFENASLVLRK
jgi:hypothetical protein